MIEEGARDRGLPRCAKRDGTSETANPRRHSRKPICRLPLDVVDKFEEYHPLLNPFHNLDARLAASRSLSRSRAHGRLPSMRRACSMEGNGGGMSPFTIAYLRTPLQEISSPGQNPVKSWRKHTVYFGIVAKVELLRIVPCESGTPLRTPLTTHEIALRDICSMSKEHFDSATALCSPSVGEGPKRTGSIGRAVLQGDLGLRIRTQHKALRLAFLSSTQRDRCIQLAGLFCAGAQIERSSRGKGEEQLRDPPFGGVALLRHGATDQRRWALSAAKVDGIQGYILLCRKLTRSDEGKSEAPRCGPHHGAQSIDMSHVEIVKSELTVHVEQRRRDGKKYRLEIICGTEEEQGEWHDWLMAVKNPALLQPTQPLAHSEYRTAHAQAASPSICRMCRTEECRHSSPTPSPPPADCTFFASPVPNRPEVSPSCSLPPPSCSPPRADEEAERRANVAIECDEMEWGLRPIFHPVTTEITRESPRSTINEEIDENDDGSASRVDTEPRDNDFQLMQLDDLNADELELDETPLPRRPQEEAMRVGDVTEELRNSPPTPSAPPTESEALSCPSSSLPPSDHSSSASVVLSFTPLGSQAATSLSRDLNSIGRTDEKSTGSSLESSGLNVVDSPARDDADDDDLPDVMEQGECGSRCAPATAWDVPAEERASSNQRFECLWDLFCRSIREQSSSLVPDVPSPPPSQPTSSLPPVNENPSLSGSLPPPSLPRTVTHSRSRSSSCRAPSESCPPPSTIDSPSVHESVRHSERPPSIEPRDQENTEDDWLPPPLPLRDDNASCLSSVAALDVPLHEEPDEEPQVVEPRLTDFRSGRRLPACSVAFTPCPSEVSASLPWSVSSSFNEPSQSVAPSVASSSYSAAGVSRPSSFAPIFSEHTQRTAPPAPAWLTNFRSTLSVLQQHPPTSH